MAKTINERLADQMIRRHLFVQRVTNREVKKILDLWSRLRPDLIGRLAAAMEGRDTNQPLLSNKALATLLKAIDGSLRTGLQQHFKMLQNDLADFADSEAEYYPDLLSRVVQPALSVPASSIVVPLTGAQVAAAALSTPFQGNTMLTWPESLTQWVRTLITNNVRSGYLQGKPTMQILSDVRRSLGGKGAQAVSSVVKTAVNHYSATARELTAKANSDLIEARWWLSTLDTHTSPMCQLRDRLFYPVEVKADSLGVKKLGGKPVIGSQYGAGPGKLHYCCRSTETWKIRGVKDLPDSVRPALNSTAAGLFSTQVPASTSFMDWVQNQPRYVLEQLYGAQRADQILKGVKVPTMFNDNGAMMTINQLKDKGLWRDND